MTIQLSKYPVPTLNRMDHSNDWLSSLKNQFGFNSRPRQRPLGNSPSSTSSVPKPPIERFGAFEQDESDHDDDKTDSSNGFDGSSWMDEPSW